MRAETDEVSTAWRAEKGQSGKAQRAQNARV